MESKGPDDAFAHAQDESSAHIAYGRRHFFAWRGQVNVYLCCILVIVSHILFYIDWLDSGERAV